MPSWTVTCSDCGSKITHSKIEFIDASSYYLPRKPEIKSTGSEMSCPHCGKRAIYQRSDLRYQAGDPVVDSVGLLRRSARR